jgi:endonuclease/exonuclease/phosphatase (EEP) superfamily protein YafD
VTLRLLAWSAVAGVGVIGLSQTISRGSSLPPIYIGQALSPYLMGAMVPLAIVAFVLRDLPLGLVAAAASLPLLVLSGPLVRPEPLPPASADAPTLTVLSANVLWRNESMVEAATLIAATDVDVIVISELTDEFETELESAGVLETHPHRAGTPDTWNRGLGLWSRYPILDSVLLPVVGRTTVEAVIDVDGTPLRVIGAHPSQPISPLGRDDWKPALRQITEIALEPGAAPTVVVGDLNASWWHPPYREMIDAGLRDVHHGLGHGFGRSWPDDRWYLPAFVRIDHALVAPGATATAIRDLRIPGSDHVAFVVTVTPAVTPQATRRDRTTMTQDDTRPARRRPVILAIGWAVTATLVFVLFTQMFGSGSDSSVIFVLQSLTPYLFPLALPIGIAALITRRRALAAANGVVLAGLVVLVAPLVNHPEPTPVDPDAPTLTVLHANVYWNSDDVVRAADDILDVQADVLALSEVTPAMAATLDALGAAEGYPHRVGTPHDGTDGVVLWSRLPLANTAVERVQGRQVVQASVLIEGRELRLVVGHPAPPLSEGGRDAWVPALAQLNALAREGDTPTLLVADVNASWWHPPYRRTLTDGLTDVHRVLGDGFSVSWPTDRRLVPAFTRLDHALYDGAVQPLSIDDLAVSGSDHDAFIVSVAVGLP